MVARGRSRRNSGTFLLLLAAMSLLLPVENAGATSPARSRGGRWVTVRPGPGAPRGVVRAYVPAREMNVVTRIDVMVRKLPRNSAGITGFPLVRKVVEPGLEGSAVIAMQVRVLDTLAGIVGTSMPALQGWPVTIVLARTQAFISTSLAELGCGVGAHVVLMGATVCGRHVIVSNITGFLHADHPGQEMTNDIESRAEKPVAQIPGFVLMRTTAALAHEFAHVWRAAALGGDVRGDEPKWFAEGLAEFWSGVAEVRSDGGVGPYLRRHVLRLRNFVDVRRVCPGPLVSYSQVGALGCEYHLGLFAVEYLVARHSSLAAMASALAGANGYATFSEWFTASFGLTVDQFAVEFDSYVRAVRRESRG